MSGYRTPIFALLLVLAAHGCVNAAVLDSNTDYGGVGNWGGTADADIMTNNSGVTINGSILAEGGNDQVIMETGPDRVSVLIDGGAGTDTIVYAGGTWTQGHAKVVNFEDYQICATSDLILDGAWDIGAKTAQVNGGSLTVNNSLTASGLTISSGGVTITGSAIISGTVNNSDNLAVDGYLSAASLINSGGVAVAGSLRVGSFINNGALGIAGSVTADSMINTGGVGMGGPLTVGSLINSGALGVATSLTAGSLINSGNIGVGGTLTAGSLINSGNIGVGMTLIAGSLINSGDVAVGGTLTAGSLTNSGFLAVGGSLTSDSLDNSGTLNADGSLTTGSLANSGDFTISSGGSVIAGSLVNSGHANIIGNANISGLAANSGTLDVTGSLTAGSLTNSGNAYFKGSATISGQAVSSGYLNVSGLLRAGSLTNSGTAYLAGRTIVGGLLTNSGNLTLATGGTLTAGSFSNSGYAAIRGTADISGTCDNSGSLIVNGSLTTGSLTNSGYIGGTGIIHADIIATGTIMPGNSIGTLNVASSVVFEPGSTLVAELDCTCLCDLLNVSGPVTINGGSIYTAIPRALYAAGHSWKIICAGQGVTGLFDSVDNQTGSEVLSLNQLNTGDGLSLVTVRKSYGAFASGGAADAGRALDKLVPLASGNMENLLVSMDFDMTADQISQIVNAVNPEMYTAFSAASLKTGRLFDRAMGQRLTELGQRRAYSLAGGRDGNGLVQLAAADAAPMAGVSQQPPPGWGMWGRAMGLWADQDQADGYLGRGQTTGGAAIGADYAVNGWLVLGLAAGATRTDLSWSNGNYSGDIDTMHTGLYARAGSDGFFARATASYAGLSNNATRPINFEGFSAEAKGDFNANLYAAGLTLGYQARVGAWLLEPLAGLDYQHLREEGFTENGAGFLGYDIAGRDTDSTMFNLGLSATRLIRADGWDLLPRLGISWQHQFGDDRPSLDASFTGYGSAPFRIYGAEFPSDMALIEAGLSLAMRPGLDFFADYSLAVADGYHAQTLTAGLKFSF